MVRKAPGLIAEVETFVASHFAGTKLNHPLHGVVVAGSWTLQVDGRRDDPSAIARAYESLFLPDDLIYVVDHGDVSEICRDRYLTGAYDEQSRKLRYTADSGAEFQTSRQTFFRVPARNLAHRALLLDSVRGDLIDAPYVINSTRPIIARSLRSFLNLYAPQSEVLDPVRSALPRHVFQDRRLCG